MFEAKVTYEKGKVLTYSNPEKTFTKLFNEEELLPRLAAFDQDRIEIRGEVLPEDPIRFVVDGIKFNDFDLELDYVTVVTKYLKLDFTPKVEIKWNKR